MANLPSRGLAEPQVIRFVEALRVVEGRDLDIVTAVEVLSLG